MQVACQNIQQYILPGEDQLRLFLRLRRQKRGMGVNALHRGGGMLMAGTGDVGIHIILSKAHLPPNFVGMDLALADQIVNRRFADVENIRDFLR